MRQHRDTIESTGYVFVWLDEDGEQVCSYDEDAAGEDCEVVSVDVTIEFSGEHGEAPTRTQYAMDGHHPGCDPSVTIHSITVEGGEWDGEHAVCDYDAEELAIEYMREM